MLQILKLKSKDINSKTLHANFYASRIKNKRIRKGVKYAPPPVWSVFKSPGKVGLKSDRISIPLTQFFDSRVLKYDKSCLRFRYWND